MLAMDCHLLLSLILSSNSKALWQPKQRTIIISGKPMSIKHNYHFSVRQNLDFVLASSEFQMAIKTAVK